MPLRKTQKSQKKYFFIAFEIFGRKKELSLACDWWKWRQANEKVEN